MYRLTSQKARTSQPRKPFFGATVRIRIIIEVLPTLGHVAALLRRLLAMRDCKPVSAEPPLDAWCAAMPYRGRRGKSRGCFALDKEGIPQCNRKKRKRDRKKEKRPIGRKRSLLEKRKKEKGEEERYDGKRADGRVV